MSERISFSVIVPIYNAEKTLIRCIESLLLAVKGIKNTVQIILIDDGSTDQTRSICEEYTRRDQRIKYIHQTNQGVSVARNSGLNAATGEYILFVDSDDCMMPDCFQHIVEVIDQNASDYYLFSCDEWKGNNRKHIRRKNVSINGRKNTLKMVSKLIVTKEINSPCAKVYKREILEKNNIRFVPGLSISEDNAFNYAYSMCISSISISAIPIYEVYIDDGNSLSRRKRNDLQEQSKMKDDYINARLLSSNLNKSEKQYYEHAFGFLVYRSVYTKAKRMIKEKKPQNERRKQLDIEISKICKKKKPFPKTIYCMAYVLPVWLRMSWFIDFGMKWIYKK